MLHWLKVTAFYLKKHALAAKYIKKRPEDYLCREEIFLEELFTLHYRSHHRVVSERQFAA
jgi:hypothetical protein